MKYSKIKTTKLESKHELEVPWKMLQYVQGLSLRLCNEEQQYKIISLPFSSSTYNELV